ncbi:MAG: DUF192 domain-containing protein [Candidatus Aminicenantes bacterium]|nr:DUF192 domain-containing protein [Candidatus Aminicenantes bacterium]
MKRKKIAFPGAGTRRQFSFHYAIISLLLVLIMLPSILHAKITMIPLYIGEEKFKVEIADTDEKQIRGLMFRKSIPDDFGMLFPYKDEDIRGFWMKNTLVHLDLIYLNRDKQVVDMFINVPPCESEPCKTYVSKKPAKYVLELRGNRARELNIKIGDAIFFLLND